MVVTSLETTDVDGHFSISSCNIKCLLWCLNIAGFFILNFFWLRQIYEHKFWQQDNIKGYSLIPIALIYSIY